MHIVVNLVLTAVLLQMVAGLTRSLEVSSWSAAFIAAAVFAVLGMLIGSAIGTLWPTPTIWQLALYRLAFNVVTVGLTAWALPGITLRGPLGLLAGGVAVTLAEFATPYVVAVLIAAGIPVFQARF